MKKWARELNRKLSKEEGQMTNKCMKKCPNSLAIKEMQIKTILKFHLTLSNGHLQEQKQQQMLAKIQ
jgi:hypothetical protein